MRRYACHFRRGERSGTDARGYRGGHHAVEVAGEIVELGGDLAVVGDVDSLCGEIQSEGCASTT
ncbi:hypothetical protein BOO86_14220 [Mycobacterium sp. CBMA 234]|nr:hypothetical protein [Mycolicibacterium sp. CBMA 234]